MGNRSYDQFRYSLEKAVVDLFGQVTFGAAGAPTLAAAESKGIQSIVRTGAGAYNIFLGTGLVQDIYYKTLMFKVVFKNATAPASPGVFIVADTVNVKNGFLSVQFNAAGVATDPGTGEVALLQVSLRNSNAP